MSMSMRASVVVPSKNCDYLTYLLQGLRHQSIKPYEIVIVIKNCNTKLVENICRTHSLSCIVIEQKKGYVTHALNIGKKEVRGDIMLITDDDALPLNKWIERYIKAHRTYSNIVGISSRDIYLDPHKSTIIPTPDDKILIRFYRWFVRPWLEPPHPLLKKYRLGVYLTNKLDIAHGPYIPYRICYSLPFRGVNMSFKVSYVYDIWFPEHELLRRAIGFEQHFGLQMILKGLDTIYIPDNPVLHLARSESLSRTKKRYEIIQELEIMKTLYKDVLQKHGVYV